MIASIKYTEIANFSLNDLVGVILNKPKGLLTEVLASDIMRYNKLNEPIYKLNYDDIFAKGLYLFFDDRDILRYVGKSKNGFYGRLMNQMNTKHKPFWGWNVVLSKMATERSGKNQPDLIDEDYKMELKVLLKYKILLIEVETEIDNRQLGRLERFVMKVFHETGEHNILNRGFGKLKKSELTATIDNLLNRS